MDPGRGDSKDDVAVADVAPRQQSVALDGADGKAGEVEIAGAVDPRHLGGLAADQRGTGDAAALGDSGNYRRRMVGIEPSGREIVEEEQRLGALDDKVVDAHRHEIDADRIEAAGLDRELQFGPDAVGGRDQDRIGKPGGLEVEQAAEPADRSIRSGSLGTLHERSDQFDQAVAGVDIDPGIGVTGRLSPVRGHAAFPKEIWITAFPQPDSIPFSQRRHCAIEAAPPSQG
jgi:hypothetical protein